MNEVEIVWKATVVADGKCLGGTEKTVKDLRVAGVQAWVSNGAFPEYKASEVPLRQPSQS